MTIFTRTESGNEDFRHLVTLLDAHLAARDGEEHSFYAQFNSIESLRNVIVCYMDDQPIACGAFKEYEKTKVEVKRMYVLPAYRGHGIGLKLLKELELWAAELHYNECILETGKKQPEAIRLYKKAGYEITENYGQYQGVENSVCMRKQFNDNTIDQSTKLSL